MDPETANYRGEIARRLKAGRWLAGSIEATGKGRAGVAAKALTTAELAARYPLPENGITESLIGTIERMERQTNPMELQAVAQALGLGDDWFEPALSLLVRSAQDSASEQLRTLAGEGVPNPGARHPAVPEPEPQTGTRS